jgi:hypothetical protein
VAKLEGFEKAQKTEKKKRTIIGVEGLEKEGKTSFALSAPGPIALFNMDIGLEGVVEKYIDEKEILVADFDYRDATSASEWVEMWERIKKAFLAAGKNKDIRTVVLDTATEMWELLRLARFGKLTQVQPYHYGPVNTEYRDLIRKIYDTDKNLILLHKMKSEYINDKSTGEMIRSGFADTGYLTQINIRVWRRNLAQDGRSVNLKINDGTFGLTVADCRQKADVAGVELTDPLNTFPMLMTQVYPETDSEEWE